MKLLETEIRQRIALDGPMPLAEFMASAGAEVGVSDWVEVGQDMIDAFAQLTGDLQFIHVDPARAAAEGPFGGAVAHGFLTLSLLSRLGQDVIRPVEGVAAKVNYGFDKVRFRNLTGGIVAIHSGVHS